jgi:hypothetical protein
MNSSRESMDLGISQTGKNTAYSKHLEEDIVAIQWNKGEPQEESVSPKPS